MAKIQLKDKNSEQLYPKTLADIVMLSDGTDVESALGTKAVYYTADEATEANTASGAVEGDENYIKEGDVKTASTGIYALIDNISQRLAAVEKDELDDVEYSLVK